MLVEADSLSINAAYALMTTVVVPRPIAWCTTVDGDHVNLAPFSYFNALCSDPPMVTISIADGRGGVEKDTLRLLRKSGTFGVNLVEAPDLERMNLTSAELPPDVSEASRFGIETVPFGLTGVCADVVRVASARVAMACRVVDLHRYGRDKKVTLVVGEVVAFSIDDSVHEDGVVVGERLSPVARLDGPHYALGGQRVAVARPARDRG